MTDPAPKKELSAGLRLAIDFGPLLLFFLANSYAPVPKDERIFAATGVFMAATLTAMLVSKLKAGSISPLLWFNGIVVAAFGGLTLWLHNDMFIKVKPTILYSLYGVLLTYALLSGKPLLKNLLKSAYPAMADEGWRLLTRNWALFFIVMAMTNEAVWRSVTTDQWVTFKTWIVTPLSLIFAMAQTPIILKHDRTEADNPPLVPPQG